MRRGRLKLSTVLILAGLAGLSTLSMVGGASAYQAKDDDHPIVVLDTTAGPITLQLDRTKAPISVDNFLKYVDKGFYDGLIFHRVIPGFMIQGGGMQEASNTLQEKKAGAFPPIKNESSNGLRHARGSLAMARTPNPDSATSQFFINVADNAKLDFTAKTDDGWSYTVFGKVTTGMDVADKIVAVPTGAAGPFTQDAPKTPILIKSAHRL
jgi:peptidyl-prolyl cis-trans isomerase B (cyclophilin B)